MNVISSDRGLRALERVDELDGLVTASQVRPVIIFKHSPTCGTSAQAFEEIQDLLAASLDADIYVANVLRHRPVCQAIADRFGIRHESPQVLVLRNGEVVWHGSHYRVTADAIRDAVGA